MLDEVAFAVEIVAGILARVVHFAAPGNCMNISRPIKGMFFLHVFFPILKINKKLRRLLAFFRNTNERFKV